MKPLKGWSTVGFRPKGFLCKTTPSPFPIHFSNVCHRLRQRKCFTISSRCQQVVGKSAPLSAHVSGLWQKRSAPLSVHVVSRVWERLRQYQFMSVAVAKSASLSAHVVAKRVRHYQLTSSAGCGKVSASLSVHVVSRSWQRECVTISSRQQVVATKVRHYQLMSTGCGK